MTSFPSFVEGTQCGFLFFDAVVSKVILVRCFKTFSCFDNCLFEEIIYRHVWQTVIKVFYYFFSYINQIHGMIIVSYKVQLIVNQYKLMLYNLMLFNLSVDSGAKLGSGLRPRLARIQGRIGAWAWASVWTGPWSIISQVKLGLSLVKSGSGRDCGQVKIETMTPLTLALGPAV